MGLGSSWVLIRKTAEKFSEDHCSLFAAALAYYALVSVVPVMMLAISLVGFILGSSDTAVYRILSFTQTMMPGAMDYVPALMQSVIESRGLVTGLGIIGLIWSGLQIFLILEKAMNIAWRAPRARGRFKSYILAICMTLSVGLFFLPSFAMTLTASVIQKIKIPGLRLDPSELPSFTWPILGFLASCAVSVVVFVALYKIIPNRKVPWRSAVLGALVTAILFESAKAAFAFYVTNFGNFDKVYGPIAGTIGFVLWVYYGASVILYGAEFASEYTERFSSYAPVNPSASMATAYQQRGASKS